MAKAKKTTPPVDNTVITDIEHENIHHEPDVNGQVRPLELVAEEMPTVPAVVPQSTELVIADALKRYEIADAVIKQFKKQAGKLSIRDIDDKEGYKKVKELWQLVRGRRLAVGNKHKEIKAFYLEVSRAIDGEKNRLTDALTPIEEQLKAMLDKIDDLKEAEKQKKQKEEEDRLNLRVEKLTNLGATMKSGYYTLGETVSMDIATLRTMTDAQYESLYAAAEKVANDLVEQKRLKDEADEQERQRLAKQKQDQEDQAEELRKQQEKLDKQREDLEKQQKAMKEMVETARAGSLSLLGFKRMGADFIYDNGFKSVSKSAEFVFNLYDDIFKTLLVDLSREAKQADMDMADHEREKAEELEKLTKRKTLIGDQMADAGFTYNFKTEEFGFKNDFLDISYKFSALIPMEDFEGMAADLKIRIAEAKQQQADKAEADQKKAEADRLAKQSDDQLMANACEDALNFVYQLELKYINAFKTEASIAAFTTLTKEMGATISKHHV